MLIWNCLKKDGIKEPPILSNFEPLNKMLIRRKVIMEIPVGKCSNCGKMINMWRCGDIAGGGTYHIVCFECSARDSRQSGQLTALWRWVVGWILVSGFILATFFVLLIFGGH